MAKRGGGSRGVKARGGGKGKGGRGPAGPSAMPVHLQRSYVSGKVAARIGWGRPGDFRACVAQATAHGVPKRMRPGMCARLHRLATGRFPGRGRGH